MNTRDFMGELLGTFILVLLEPAPLRLPYCLANIQVSCK